MGQTAVAGKQLASFAARAGAETDSFVGARIAGGRKAGNLAEGYRSAGSRMAGNLAEGNRAVDIPAAAVGTAEMARTAASADTAQNFALRADRSAVVVELQS